MKPLHMHFVWRELKAQVILTLKTDVDSIVHAFYVKKRPFTEQIATEAFSTGFDLVRYPL